MRLKRQLAIVCTFVSSLLGAMTFVAGAEAAVRECKPLVVGDVASARSEREAKRSALSSWKAKAKAAGVAHPAWRIAINKTLKCEPVGRGHDCIALGQPCTIRQVPAPRHGIRPDGTQPRDI